MRALASWPSIALLCAAGQVPAEAWPPWALGPFTKTGKPVLSPTAESVFACPVERRSMHWEPQNVYNPVAVVREGRVYRLYYGNADRQIELAICQDRGSDAGAEGDAR
jgi:hypothetical protein